MNVIDDFRFGSAYSARTGRTEPTVTVGKRISEGDIELPHPRTLDLKTHETFGVYTRRIYKLLGME